MSTHIEDATLQAYVDGELPPDEAARIEAAIAAHPALADRVQRERALRQRLRAAFDPVLEEPVPSRLRALLEADAHADGGVRDIAAARAQRAQASGDARRPRFRAMPAYALAASLLLLALTLWMRPDAALVREQDGRLVAAGVLERGLDASLASAPDARAAVAIGLTFRDAQGRICRSFAHRGTPAIAGLACRDDDAWTLPTVVEAPQHANGELRQAGAEMPPEVQAAVDARLQGEVFDARQERAARDAGWR